MRRERLKRVARITLACVLGSLGSVAWAAPVTIWLSEDLPEEKLRDKADLQTDEPADHRTVLALRYPPAPEVPADQAALDQILAAIEAGQDRWTEFEVELLIAGDIENVVEDIELLRSSRDVNELVRGLLFQGTAVARSTSAITFDTDARVARFRRTYGDVSAPSGWIDAYALTGEPAERADVVDGTGWQDYQRFVDAITSLDPATIVVPDGIGTVWVDGQAREPGELSLPPGRHWIHVVRDGRVAGRSVVALDPGETLEVSRAIAPDDESAATAAVIEGRKVAVPDAVLDAAAAILEIDGGPLYLATTDGRKVMMLPLSKGATLKDTTLLTHVLHAGVGGGVMISDGFVGQVDQNGNSLGAAVAGAASASIGYELGISYFMLDIGIDAAVTPGWMLPYEQDETSPSTFAAMHPQPYLALGAYALRPTKPSPTVSIAAMVQMLAPAYLGPGGRIAVGVPIDDTTWLRISVGGAYAPTNLWGGTATENSVGGGSSTPAQWVDNSQLKMASAWLRVGFGRGM